jgi:hypothetical protein
MHRAALPMPRRSFLDSSEGGKVPTASILADGGVAGALRQLTSGAGGGFSRAAFEARDAVYAWSRRGATEPGCGATQGGAAADIEDTVPE